MINLYKERVWFTLLAVIFLGTFVSTIVYSYNRYFDHDEFEHIHTAWMILQGKEIFVDFFQHHHPFFDYLLSGIVYIFGSSVDVLFYSRYLMLVFIAGILVVTYILSLRVFKKHETAIVSIILTLTVVAFFRRSIEIRPDVPQTFFALLSIYFLFTYYDKKSLVSLLACSVSLAVSYLLLQKSISLMFIIGIFLLYDLIKSRVSLKHVILFCAVFLICILPYYIYLFLSGSFEQYYLTNWLVNMYLPQHYPRLDALYDVAIRKNPVTVFLYILGTVIIFVSGEQKKFALFSLFLIITTVLAFKNLLLQYLMPLIPLVAIIASYTIFRVTRYKVLRLVLIIGAISLPLLHMHNKGFFNMDNIRQADQIEKVEYVLLLTDEDDLVYDGNRRFNLFRNDVDYFWFSLDTNQCLDTYDMIASYNYNIYDLIDSKRPKVISTFDIKRLDDRRIIGNYSVSDKYPYLLIRNN